MSQIRGTGSVDQLSEARLWKTLDTMVEKLSRVEDQLSEVVRLEERVNNHEKALARYGDRLDEHGRRIRDTELWQANHGDRDSMERMIANLQNDIHDIENDIKGITTGSSRREGQVDVSKKVLGWVTTVLAGVVIFLLTKGK